MLIVADNRTLKWMASTWPGIHASNYDPLSCSTSTWIHISYAIELSNCVSVCMCVCVPKHFNHNTSLAILLTLFSSIGYYLRLFQQNKNATCFVFELEISISNLVESFDWFNFDWILSSSTSPPLFKSSIIGVNMVCLWIVLIITHQWRIEPRWMEVNSNHSTNSH